MKKCILIFTVILLISSGATAQTDDAAALGKRLEPLINESIKQHHIPGLALGAMKNGKVVYENGFGVAKLGADKPVTAQSLFHMASVTKTFVATAIMQLVEQGKIDLDAPLVKYLPYFRLKDDRYTAITIRQTLSHTAGIPDATGFNWDKPEYDDGSLERYVRSIGNYQMVSAPGERYAYSNIAYEVLGDVVAKVSGKSFEEYVQKNILTPLGMKHSTLLVREADPQLLVAPHVTDGNKVVVSSVFPYNRAHAPSSTLYSNIEDMLRWAKANLNRGELEGKRILKAASYDLLWKPVADANDSGTMKICLSWFQANINGHRIILHSGGDVGFESLLLLAPDDSVAVVSMINFSAPSGSYVGDAAVAAMKLLLGLDPSPRLQAQAPVSAQIQTDVNGVTLEQVLEKYVAAIGGRAALEKLTSRVSKGTFEVEGFALKGPAEIYAKAPNKYLLTLEMAGQGSYQRGFDGEAGWEQDPDTGLVDLKGSELSAARRDSEFYQGLELRELYPKIALKGRWKLGDREVYILEAPRAGSPKLWYFSAETGLLLRTEEKGADGSLTGAEEYEDYREVDGVKLPFTLRITEKFKLTIKLTQIKHNVSIDDAKFSKPAK